MGIVEHSVLRSTYKSSPPAAFLPFSKGSLRKYFCRPFKVASVPLAWFFASRPHHWKIIGYVYQELLLATESFACCAACTSDSALIFLCPAKAGFLPAKRRFKSCVSCWGCCCGGSSLLVPFIYYSVLYFGFLNYLGVGSAWILNSHSVPFCLTSVL